MAKYAEKNLNLGLKCQQVKVGCQCCWKIPNGRFKLVSIDIIGSLPPSKWYRYCLTRIDRFTGWAKAFPLQDITAESVVKLFLSGWIPRLGMPSQVVTDRPTVWIYIVSIFKIDWSSSHSHYAVPPSIHSMIDLPAYTLDNTQLRGGTNLDLEDPNLYISQKVGYRLRLPLEHL